MIEVVEACRGLRDLHARRDALLEQRESAIRRMRADGHSPAAISRMLTDALHAAGFNPAEVRGLGVSEGAVRRATERPRV